jgi:hypothetical protein
VNELTELFDATDQALETLNRHPEHKLTLNQRVQIWKLMGPRLLTESSAIPDIGLRRRTKLAILCTKKVLNLWEAAFSEDRQPHQMLTTANQYLNQRIDRFRAWDRMNDFWATLESLFFADKVKWSIYVGCAAAATVKIAIFDEALADDYIDETNADRAQELADWDAALFACLAYSREGYLDESISRLLRKEFWEWYLKEAVPAAYQSPS